MMNRMWSIVLTVILMPALAAAQTQAAPPQAPFEPTVGQAGKDVVWVPSSPVVINKMLDMAHVSAQDFVVDLGSGDGRNVIAAAKRGARALGVEFNADMVALSQRLAREAGVADKASFVQGDMYEADFSKASALALFLLPHNLEQLRDKFLALKPGTRIVLNTYAIPAWEADERETLTDECETWCTSLLYIVPANAAGTWRLPQGQLTLTQEFQIVSGTLSSGAAGSAPIANGRLRGDQISFSVGATDYTGRINGDRIDGTATTGGKRLEWFATRVTK